MTKAHTLAFTCLSLVFLACCSSDPAHLIVAGQEALGSGDSKTALSKFKKAAAGLEPTDPRFVEAKLGMIEALFPTQPGEATDEFLSLGKSHPAQVGEKELVYVIGLALERRQYPAALYLVDNGAARFGTDSTWFPGMIDRIQRETANDPVFQEGMRTMACYFCLPWCAH